MYSLVGLFLIDHVYITTTKSHEAAGYENLRNPSHLLQMTTVFLCLPKATTDQDNLSWSVSGFYINKIGEYIAFNI